MKIVALIDCPGLIRRILEHLNLWEPINRMIRPRSPPIEEYPEAHLGAWKGICFRVKLHSLRCRWELPNSQRGWTRFRQTMSLLLLTSE